MHRELSMARLLSLSMVLALALAGGALAQGGAAKPPAAAPVTPPAAGPAPQDFKPLVETKGVVSWKTLAQVDLVKQKDRYVPQFADSVAALDRKDVKVQGFMMPLEMGDKQMHFILSATPQTCNFCVPGGPEQFIEVRMKKAIKYTFEPIVVSGRMTVLKDDPTGVFYRVTDAVAVAP